MNHRHAKPVARTSTCPPGRHLRPQIGLVAGVLGAWAAFVAMPSALIAAPIQAAAPGPVRESVRLGTWVTLGGIEQWITIRGDDIANPVVLILHGGPGATLSPFADAIFGDWERAFTLVQWDQRGAGRTFGRQAPAELTEEFLRSHPLELERMVADGIELVRHLTGRLGGGKVILFGTSWGSVLGTRMAREAPGLLHAYVGHSQVVNPAAGLLVSYRTAQDLAHAAGDRAAAELLEALGSPPYSDARQTGQLLRVIKRYERRNSAAAPDSWWQWSPEYDNETDRRHRSEGDDYSFAYYVGHAGMGIAPMLAEIDLTRQATTFEIPIFLVQGENDLLTPREGTRAWFDSIEAPLKEYHLIPGAAHDFTVEVVNHLGDLLRNTVLPSMGPAAARAMPSAAQSDGRE